MEEKFIEQFYNLLCIQITKTHEMVNLWSVDNISLKFIELNFRVLIPLEINTIIPFLYYSFIPQLAICTAYCLENLIIQKSLSTVPKQFITVLVILQFGCDFLCFIGQ